MPVQRVLDVRETPVAELGPHIESHPRFARRVNAGFMQVISKSQVALRVYERGVGETLACGTAPALRWSPASASAGSTGASTCRRAAGC